MIGQLDRRIQFLSRTVTQTATGEPSRSWSSFLTCWAQVEESSGGETITADTPTVTHELLFTVRYRSTITELLRILYNGKNYQITHIEEIERRNYLKITASIPDNE